jgi:hypothetical protein
MSAGAASAASFDFSFDIAGADYTGNGTFNGDLQGDSDTILNMSNMKLSYTTGGRTYANTGNPIDEGEWSLSGVTADWGTNAPGPGGMYIGGGEVGFGDPGNFLTAYDPSDFIISVSGAPVTAVSFAFSFDIAGADYTGRGTFNGDLQGDSDTILNMSDMKLSYTTGGSTYVNTGNPIDEGEWSLSGVTADWVTNSTGPGGMGMNPGFVGFGDPSEFLTAYDLNDFIITVAGVTAPVPVPAALPLMLGGIAGLGLLARRKRG